MAVYVSFCPLGVFAVGGKGEERARQLFEKGKEAEGIIACMGIKLSADENKLLAMFSDDNVVFEAKKQGYEHEFPNPAGKFLRENLESLAINSGFVKSKEDFSRYISEISMAIASKAMVSSFSSDRLAVQAIGAIDELDRSFNTLAMRLREWYGFYFPELVQKLQDNEQFVAYVYGELYRKPVKGIDVEASIGADLDKKDLEEMQAFAHSIETMLKQRKRLEGYVEACMAEIMPNTAGIIGGMAAARLLSIAGSLEKLAKFPSSTIQILGAEKALFRHIVSGGKSPKYGILFQTSYIQQAPQERKGKMARLLASKLSMAMKVDFYKGEPVGERYKKELDGELARMKRGK